MFLRALLPAALTVVYIYEVFSAIPFTELQRTLILRDSNTGLDFWRSRRARDTQIQLTTSQPLQTTSPPFNLYFANYSLVGQEVECSDAAKRCLAINRLLYEPLGECYELGDPFPCRSDGSLLVLDADSYRRGTLRSKCSRDHRCKYVAEMAYDRKCYPLSYVVNKICDGIENVAVHPLGGWECKIPKQPHERAMVMYQPTSPGRCVIPNLQQNDIRPFLVQCSPAEEGCLEKKLLPFEGTCQTPFSRTSCPDGQWLVLDEDAAESGLLSAKCKSSQPCGSDAQLLRADQSCHTNKELIEELCNNSFILPLPTGDYICTNVNRRYEVHGLRNENGVCEVQVLGRRIYSDEKIVGAISVRGEKCILNDKNICQQYVSPPISKPDLSPENR